MRLAVHHRKLPGQPWAVCCCKKLPHLVRLGWLPRSRECLRQCSPSCARWTSRVSPRLCERVGFSRPVLSPIWPFGGGLIIEQMASSCRLHPRQAPHRDNGGCPPSPRLRASQPRLCLHVSVPPELLPLHRRPREGLHASLSAGPLGKCLAFPAAFCFTGRGTVLADFHCGNSSS